jgi:hypothetical protein
MVMKQVSGIDDERSHSSEANDRQTNYHQPTCDLCAHPLGVDHRTVPTTTGEFVHIACADREALVAARHRLRMALISGAAMILVVLLLLWFIALLGLFLLPMLAVLHVRLNRVWWRHIFCRMRRGWRRMMRVS